MNENTPESPKLLKIKFSRSSGVGAAYDSKNELIILYGQSIDVINENDGSIKY